MKFSVVAILGALAAVVNAKAAFTNTEFNVQAGQPFTLSWSNATGPVTIDLVSGPTTDLKPVGGPIVSGASGTSTTWTPPATLASGTYAFRITDSTGEPNFSLQFTFQGSASASGSTSTPASSTSASTTASSSAASSTSINTTTSGASTTASTTTTKTTASTTTSASKSATTVPTNNNDSQRVKSSLALVLLTVAALVCFN